MTKTKTIAIGLTTALIAALSIGADFQGSQRPPAVPAAQWISLNDRAGFAVIPSQGSQTIGAQLYLKTDVGWRAARLENPAELHRATH